MYIADSTIDQMVAQILDHAQGKTSSLLVGEHSSFNMEELIDALNAAGARFLGGIFPKVIHDNTIYETGIVQNTFENVEEIFTVKHLDTGDFTIPEFHRETGREYTLITYVDGLTQVKSAYLLELYNRFGADVNYVGGGAGSLSLEQMPCVFTHEGIFQDAAVCGLVAMDVSLAVRHGWEKIAGPFIATRTKGNVVQELNWRNAFEVYKEVVEARSGKTFTDSNFFDIAKGHPFGIVREHTERIVRDPLAVNEKGHLICIGEVEENTFLDILEGENENLIAAARTAVEESLAKAAAPKKAVIIDCISRGLFLEEDIQKELDGVVGPLKAKNPDISISGALTLGEISSFGQGLIQLFNKTIVIGIF
ncbi:FIST C-terminal domain-containing protein [Robiginitalea sp. M366]|uniref:FIST signal transduction protein n=1 Tax=Robiginitalea aestuariiviva TaxID=3036903 RepID=UPI00240D8C47|nr:FIST C-terminal domain-containing protein [Robiginitalea aestuariiviva]MDG1571541.1 FIST C-terminal domain-containing protein [Robiginitalea aestuariiviva]